jgi:hypothetical protein
MLVAFVLRMPEVQDPTERVELVLFGRLRKSANKFSLFY